MKIEATLQMNLGTVILSEDDIIDFARNYDPLPFHTARKIAQKSIFKGLIASGPHIFNVFYRLKWIPLFGDSVIAGLEVNNWKFIKPIYAGEPIQCHININEITEKKEKGMIVVKWHYEFTD